MLLSKASCTVWLSVTSDDHGSQGFAGLAAGDIIPFDADMWEDVRYSLRLLRKTPSWTALAALTIALGIAGTATMFSIANAVLLHPLRVPQPNALYWISERLFDFRSEMALAGDYFLMRQPADPGIERGSDWQCRRSRRFRPASARQAAPPTCRRSASGSWGQAAEGGSPFIGQRFGGLHRAHERRVNNAFASIN